MLIFLLVPLLISGCVVDLGDPASGFPDPPEPAAVALDTAGGVALVEMEGLSFLEPEVTIPVGGTVVWQNHDTAFHIIAEGEPGGADPEWIGPDIQFGEEWSRTFTEPGTFVYYCDNHERTMRDAVVIVE